MFKKIDGYSNKYWGWGYEDSDLLLRCEEKFLKLDTLKIKNQEHSKQKLKFNGNNASVKSLNPIDFKTPTSIFISFKILYYNVFILIIIVSILFVYFFILSIFKIASIILSIIIFIIYIQRFLRTIILILFFNYLIFNLIYNELICFFFDNFRLYSIYLIILYFKFFYLLFLLFYFF